MSVTDPIAELHAAVGDAARALRDGEPTGPEPSLERPPKPELGDYSSNAAMLVAATRGEKPRDVAERLRAELESSLGDGVERIEVAGPGFVNLFLSDAWHRRAMAALAGAGEELGRSSADAPERVMVEFVSANPTGPLHVGGGRHAAYGDSIVRLLEATGNEVWREFYVNDAGGQIDRFAASIAARMLGREPPEDGYGGEYVIDLANRLCKEGVGPDDTEALKRVEAAGQSYRSEGALWLRTTDFGDDKDRVLERSTGQTTYFAADVAYAEHKLERGFDLLVIPLGSDHHGYVARLKANMAALGADPERLEVPILQFVHIVEGDARASMSKRRGEFITLDDLISEIGVDATRYFMLSRSQDSTIDLDLDLARSQSAENPVYYVQYAHARIASVRRKAGEERVARALTATGLDVELHPSERALVKKLLAFPEEAAEAAERRAPHRMTTYAHETAQEFSAFYRDCRVVGAAEEGGDEDVRLVIAVLTKDVLARSLALLGVEAPASR